MSAGAIARALGRVATGGMSANTATNAALAGGAAALTVPFFAREVASPVVGAVTGAEHRRRLERLKELAYGQSPASRAQRVSSLVEENRARMMALQPHTYMEFMAGRRLPRGSVYYGPQQADSRRAMDALLAAMSQGQM